MIYSTILHKKVLKTIKQGMSVRTVAKLYDISPTTVINWKKGIVIQSIIRLPRKISDDALKQNIVAYPDDYYYERAVRLGCSKSGIEVAMKRLGYTHKKASNIIKQLSLST